MSFLEERHFAVRCLFAAIALHICLHLGPSLTRNEISHDEGISLLSMTGHQGLYTQIVQTRQPPYGTWVPAAEWKKLMRPESVKDEPPPSLKAAEFNRIARDLAHYDLHPPLYFWLAHIVVVTFGSSLSTILGLNLFFDTLTIVMVFLLGREVFGRDRLAALAALLWSLSPGVITASVEARQYSLLGLLSACFFWQILRMTASTRRFSTPQLLSLSILSALGMLSQYQFSLVIAGGTLLLLREFGKSDRLRCIAAIAAMLVGVSMTLLFIQPDWLISLRQQQANIQPFSWSALGLRFLTVLGATGNFFVPGLVLRVVWAVALGIVVAAIFTRKLSIPWLHDALWPKDPAVQRAFLLGMFLFLSQAILYVGFRMHRSAMFQRYGTHFYPVFACMLVAMIHASPSSQKKLTKITLLLLVVGSIGMTIQTAFRTRSIATSMPRVREADQIILDCPRRGVVTMGLWHVPDQTPVFIASPTDLLRNPEPWLQPLTERSLWLSGPEDVKAEEREQISQLLSQRFEPVRDILAAFDDRAVYRLNPKSH